MTYDDGLKQYSTERPFEGVLPNMERRFRETDSAWVREELGRYQNSRTCEVCQGARLKPEALAVKIAGTQHQRGGVAVDRGGVRLVCRGFRDADPGAARRSPRAS